MNEPSVPPGPGRTGVPLFEVVKEVITPPGPGLTGAPLEAATGAPVEPGRGGREVIALTAGVPAEGSCPALVCVVVAEFDGTAPDAPPALPVLAVGKPLRRGPGLLGKTMRPI